MILDATTKKLQLETSAAGSVDFVTTWSDHTSTSFTPGSNDNNITTATDTDVVAAPAASTQRKVNHLAFTNRHATIANVVRPKLDVSGTKRFLHPPVTLAPGEALEWHDGVGWRHYSATGEEILQSAAIKPIAGKAIGMYKVGPAVAEAIGNFRSLHDATGFPSTWAPGTPGLAGRATDGTAAGDAGCLPIANPGSGSNFLVGFQAHGTVPQSFYLHDVLWVNSGIAVTTTTAQTINSVAFPARDLSGSTNGAGVQIGILVTTATTNGGAITNTTLSYTNQDGTAGRTATISSFPATAVAGTIVWFQLQAGDSGVRSVQSITLGTSYGGGAISLIASIMLAGAHCQVANIGAQAALRPGEQGGAGVRLYSGVCVLPFYQAQSTTATTLTGIAYVEER